MNTVEYKLSESSGKFGWFAIIRMKIEPRSSGPGMAVQLALKPASKDDPASGYASAAIYGFEYAWEHMPRTIKFGQGVTVTLTDLEAAPVDTSSVIVVYAAAYALWKALGVEPPARAPVIEGDRVGIFFPR